MTTPTQTLREEHRVILVALDLLERGSGRLAAGAALPDGWWPGIIAWLRAFADVNHHAKEERYLFPALAKACVPAHCARRQRPRKRSPSSSPLRKRTPSACIAAPSPT